MDEKCYSPKSFFDYFHKARREFLKLLEIHPELEALSPRELEVFARLLSDKTLSAIAEDMFLSYSSIHFHCKNIYRKLSLSGRRQLLMIYKDLYE